MAEPDGFKTQEVSHRNSAVAVVATQLWLDIVRTTVGHRQARFPL